MQNVINRSWKLGKLMLNARSLAKATDEEQQKRARKALMEQFADARGVMMKVGQLIAAAGETDGELAPLITSIDPLSLEEMLPAIERSLGCTWTEVFKSIDESKAAASLGQVHHAVLLNNESVAIKVQYPNIAKAIDAEMTILGLMPKAGPVKKWNFDLDGYRQALKQNMALELDYRHEAQQQSYFINHLKMPTVVVPSIYNELCSETLLVQSWEEGVFINQVANWPIAEREQAAKTLLGLLLKSLFQQKLLHGDPHRGNSYFRHAKSGVEMVLMDYGCTVELTEQQSLALLKLIIASKEKSTDFPINYFSAMGFDANKLAKIEAYLPKLCQYLFEPFVEDKIFHLPQWNVGKRITDLLADERWWFRSAGPANLIFIMRAFQGLVQQLETLKVSINWWQVLTDVLPAELINKARNYQCPEALMHKQSTAAAMNAIADVLKVKVTRQNNPLVEVTLPADAVLQLASFIPEDVLQKLEQASNINIDDIISRVRKSGIAAQTVFDFDDGEKHYLIWLE